MTTRTRMMLCTVLFAATAAGSAACGSGDSWQPPRVVTIETSVGLASLMPAWVSWLSDAEAGQPQALLLRDGDYVFASDSLFRYAGRDGQKLKLATDKGSVRLGDATVSVDLNKEDARTWLAKASDTQLAALRLVGVPSDVPAETLESLKHLASINRSVDLSFESGDQMPAVLPLFRPRAVFASDDATVTNLAALANQPQIETLLLEGNQPRSLEVLTKLPALRRLLITKWNPEVAGPLPAGLSGLKSLLIMDTDNLIDLSALTAAPAGLEELSLLGLKSLTDIKGVDKLTGLQTLVLWGDEGVGDLSGLAAHRQLRWVGLPAKTTQEQFAAFVNAHPDLAILDMMGNKHISSLAPLSTLKRLQGLVLDGPYENLSTVQGLTSLRFVGISKKTWESSPEQVAAIRKALPDAVIVRVSPLCLGSGWILLIVPVLAWLWFRRSRQIHAQ